MKTVFYSRDAKDSIAKLDGAIKLRIRAKIEALARGEVRGFFLRKPLANYQKIRVGSYRVVFQEKGEGVVYVVFVEFWGRVYGGVRV